MNDWGHRINGSHAVLRRERMARGLSEKTTSIAGASALPMTAVDQAHKLIRHVERVIPTAAVFFREHAGMRVRLECADSITRRAPDDTAVPVSLAPKRKLRLYRVDTNNG